jgi:hypothetical protein
VPDSFVQVSQVMRFLVAGPQRDPEFGLQGQQGRGACLLGDGLPDEADAFGQPAGVAARRQHQAYPEVAQAARVVARIGRGLQCGPGQLGRLGQVAAVPACSKRKRSPVDSAKRALSRCAAATSPAAVRAAIDSSRTAPSPASS